MARQNVTQFFGGEHPAWELRLGDLAEGSVEPATAPTGSSSTCWRPGTVWTRPPGPCVPAGSCARTSPPPRQLALRRDRAPARRVHRAAAWESLVRDWHVEGLAVRPAQDDRPHGVPGHRAADGSRPASPAEEAAPGTWGLRTGLHRPPPARSPDRRGRMIINPLPNRDKHPTYGIAMPRRAGRVARTGGDADVHIRRRFQHGGRSPDELASQVRFEAEVEDLRRRLTDAPGHSRGLEPGSPTPSARWQGDVAERAPGPDLARGPDQIMKLKEEVDRLAQPPAGFGTFWPATRTTPSTSSPGSQLRVNVSPSVDLDELQRGQEVMLNEALNVVAAFDFEEVGEVVMFKELLADGDRALVIANADEERVVRLAEPLRATIRAGDCCCSTHAPATSTRRCRSPRSRSSSSRRSRTSTTGDRRADQPDRPDPRRRRAALPAPRALQGAPAQAAEGRAALRASRLWQDAHRQGRRELAGQEGRQDRRAVQGGRQVVLPQHQGPRAAQQVRRRDRAAHPPGVPAGPREGRGHPGHRVLRRDGLAVPHPRLRGLLRRREHDRRRSCSARSTASSCSENVWSSAPPTART